MQPLFVIFSNKFPYAYSAFSYDLIAFGIDLLILQGPPESFYEDIIDHTAFAVHADLNLFLLENRNKFFACELRLLVGIEILRFSSLQGLFQGLTTEICFQSVGDSPGKDVTAVKIHNSHKINKSMLQTDIAHTRHQADQPTHPGEDKDKSDAPYRGKSISSGDRSPPLPKSASDSSLSDGRL
jgi:hypothetical protein